MFGNFYSGLYWLYSMKNEEYASLYYKRKLAQNYKQKVNLNIKV